MPASTKLTMRKTRRGAHRKERTSRNVGQHVEGFARLVCETLAEEAYSSPSKNTEFSRDGCVPTPFDTKDIMVRLPRNVREQFRVGVEFNGAHYRTMAYKKQMGLIDRAFHCFLYSVNVPGIVCTTSPPASVNDLLRT